MMPRELLQQWLQRRLPQEAGAWLLDAARRVQSASGDSELLRAVSLVTRRIGKSDLSPTEDELRAAGAARAGWDPRDWSVDQAARIYLLLSMGTDGAVFLRRLDQLCVTADVGELVAFYRGLPLYPDAPRYVLRAAEGVRTNMRAVFEAVAHRNPYPSEQLPEGAWNQMVLKALFVGSRLEPVIGLDARANPALARMLCDYAHERWSAGRPVSPELWRCVGPFAAGDMLADLKRVLDKGTPPERQAAALALSRSRDAAAAELLRSHADLATAVREGRLNWRSLAPAN
ncbi:MAG: EboA domain-containing protein [Burkholderiales bacterium]